MMSYLLSRDSYLKFYESYELAERDIGACFLPVEVEGGILPSSVTKTVLKDRYLLEFIGVSMASISTGNLATARFQHVKMQRLIPVAPFKFMEDVYIFETFLD